MDAPARPTEVPIKITFEKKFGVPTIRRLLLSQPTLEALRQALSQWVPVDSLVLEYMDDEGDFVAMDMEEEWTECLRQWTAAGAESAVKLRASRGKARRHGQCAVPRKGNPTRVGIWGSALEKLEVVNKVLERLYGKGSLELLAQGKIKPETLGCADWVTPLQGSDLNIDISKLAHRLHELGIQGLETGNYGSAADWFKMQADLIPVDPVAMYNLGCAKSLLGELDQAFDALDHALQRGYNNPQHMLEDPDLAALQSHPRWADLVRKLRGEVHESVRLATCSDSIPTKCGQDEVSDMSGSSESESEGPVVCATSGCPFLATRPGAKYCCRRCEKGKGSHAWRCEGKTADEQPIAVAKCDGCDFLVAHPGARFCCKQCHRKPGKHGKRCLRASPLPSDVPVEVCPPEEPMEVCPEDEDEHHVEVCPFDDDDEPMEVCPEDDAGEPVEEAAPSLLPAKYPDELAVLHAMGFAGDDDRLVAILDSTNGDLQAAVNALL